MTVEDKAALADKNAEGCFLFGKNVIVHSVNGEMDRDVNYDIMEFAEKS